MISPPPLFRERSWKLLYGSPPDDIVGDFYTPALGRAMRYDRGAGFFSASLLLALARPIDTFVRNGGRIRLLCSPANLDPEELAALADGEDLRQRLAAGIAEAVAPPPGVPPDVLGDRLGLLSWLVANGRMDVQLALRRTGGGGYGLYHEKVAVLTDAAGDRMAFSGSLNETQAAVRSHCEQITVFCGWRDTQAEYANDLATRFTAAWDGELQGLQCWSATNWLADPLRERYGLRPPNDLPTTGRGVEVEPTPEPLHTDTDDNTNTSDTAASSSVAASAADSLLPSMPTRSPLRDYQREAVDAWWQAGGRGTFAMATGTGKTFTALAAATRAAEAAAESDESLLVLVIVPLRDLVDQWAGSATQFGFRPAISHGDLRTADRTALRAAFSVARSGYGRRAEMVITTADGLTPRRGHEADHPLQRQLSRHRGRLLVIGDEMHGLGTAARLAALPSEPTHTVGLSATPKRHYDDEGTAAILDYFGQPCVEIGIAEAIQKYEALVPYDYRPTFVSLDDEEAAEFRRLSQAIAAALGSDDPEGAAKHLLRRARVAQHAAAKLDALRQLFTDGLRHESHQIVYVAEGTGPISGRRQMDDVLTIVREEFGVTAEPYDSHTPPERRSRLRRELAEGRVAALVAMRCLDEGVDIPEARTGVILASTTNPRQFVQRRGRILRRHHGKTHAAIHDCLVRLPDGGGKSERRLFGGELSRAAELAEASRTPETLHSLYDEAHAAGLTSADSEWMAPLDGDRTAGRSNERINV